MGQITKMGAGLAYNHKYYINNEQFDDHRLTNPVFLFTGIYEVSLPFHISPTFNIFFPNVTKFEDIGYTTKYVSSGYTLDIDGHYVFNSLDRFELYGLAGLNILYARRKYVEDFGDGDPFKEVTRFSSLGFNIGAGSYIKVKEQFDLFVELKAIIATQIQVMGSAGILINIDWLKKNQDPGI